MPSCGIESHFICEVWHSSMALLPRLCAEHRPAQQHHPKVEDACRGCGARLKDSPAAVQHLGCVRCACTPGCPWQWCSTPAVRPLALQHP